MTSGRTAPDLVCFSHLRWTVVYQRPHHLMSRFARRRRVFFVEPPFFDVIAPTLDVRVADGVHVVTPHLIPKRTASENAASQRRLLTGLLVERGVQRPLAWFYDPMALPLIEGMDRGAVVYDCMSEPPGSASAAASILQHDDALLVQSDVVFTAGYSLYEARRPRHPRVFPFPSSVDVPHFQRAGAVRVAPPDQRRIAAPRIGFCGAIDERMDLALVAGIAARRPEWQLILIGPVMKIDLANLPRRPNIHYLGIKPYQVLPDYMAGWEVAI